MIRVPSISEIYTNMRADAQVLFGTGSSIPTFSILNIVLVSFAGAMKLLYTALSVLEINILPDKATGELLQRQLDSRGIPVSAGKQAEGTLIFTGTPASVIPDGTEATTPSGYTYNTVGESVIESNGQSKEVPIQASTLGSEGNYIGQSLTLPTPPAGVDSVVYIKESPLGGQGPDTEEDSRRKIKLYDTTPLTLGLEDNYATIASSVDGVGRVWVQRAGYWTGPNTVVVTLATKDMLPVAPSTLTEVRNLFNSDPESNQFGTSIAVRNISTKELDIWVGMKPNTTDYQAAVEQAMQYYFSNTVQPSYQVLLSELFAAMDAAGVRDYIITRLDYGGDTVYDYTSSSISDRPTKILPGNGYTISLGTITFSGEI